MKRPINLAIVVLIMTVVAAFPAAAQIELQFTSPDQLISVGDSGSLSVILVDAIDVRTIELFISYDVTTVASVNGQPGQLFAESGCTLFPFFDEDDPGDWYGGCVTMGPTCFVTGPGELYKWNFEGLAGGTCHVQVDSVVLYNPQADVIEGVSLQGTTIVVEDLSSANMPSTEQLTLALAPNPFNPRTTISFGGRQHENVTVEVFDLTGRSVKTLWSGKLGSNPGFVQWDGTDRRGYAAPGGAYLFRICGQENRQTTRKGILLK